MKLRQQLQLKLNAAISDERSKRSSSPIALPPPKEDREKELTTMIMDMESKHGNSKFSSKKIKGLSMS